MEEKQISCKQFVIIIFIVGIAMKMFMLPAVILKVSGRDSWIPMMVFLGLEMIFLTVLLIINKKCPDKTFYQLLESALGKIISRIIVVVLILYLVVKIILVIGEIKVFFTASVFENLVWQVFIIPLLVFLVAVSIKTLRGVGRLAEFALPAIIVSMLVLGSLFIGNTEFQRLLPILSDGTAGIFKSITRYPFWFGDFATLVIFLGNIKQSKKLVTFSLISYAIAGISVMLFSMVLFSTYGTIPMLLDYGHNISNMTQNSVNSLSFGRFDIIIFSIWVLAVFVKLALIFFAVTRHMVYVSNYKNNYVHGTLLAIIVYILAIFVFPNENILFTFVTEHIRVLVAFFQIIMPILLLIIALIKGRKNKHEDNEDDKDFKKKRHKKKDKAIKGESS